MKNGWTGGQYNIFRAVFALYLLVHFLQLRPWGAELFSNRGVLPDGSASPLLHLFPNVLALNDSPAMVTALLTLGALLSVLYGIGLYDRAAYGGCWPACWSCCRRTCAIDFMTASRAVAIASLPSRPNCVRSCPHRCGRASIHEPSRESARTNAADMRDPAVAYS
jgi:hypothetical protein